MLRQGSFLFRPQGSILFRPKGSVTRARRGQTHAPFPNKYNGELKGVISPLYLCFRTHDINAEYLAWYFKSRLWHEYIYKNGDAGVRHDRVSIKDDVFFSMPLKIHSKLEQGRIANKLNKIESFVMHEIQYLSLLQTQKYFLLQQMFI